MTFESQTGFFLIGFVHICPGCPFPSAKRCSKVDAATTDGVVPRVAASRSMAPYAEIAHFDR